MNKNMESKQYKNKSKYAPFFYKGKQGSLKHSGHGNDNGSGGYNSNNNSGGGNYSVGNSSSYMYKKRYNNYNSSYDVKHNGGSSYNHDEIYGSERKGMNGAGVGGSHSGHSSRALYKYNGGNNSSSNTGNRYGSSSYAFKKREAKQVSASSCNGNKNESATDGNEESKNRCETGEVDTFVSAANNKGNVHKDDSLNVQGNIVTGTATTENIGQGDSNQNAKDSIVHENIHDNNGSGNASREDNNSVGSAQGDRKGCYELKEYRDVNTTNMSSNKMNNVGTPFCSPQEDPSHEKSFGDRQENPIHDSSSDAMESEDRNYMHDVAGVHDDADNFTEMENDGAVSVASSFDVVDSGKDVGEKLTNDSSQSMEHKAVTMDMVKNNIREIEHEYEENQTADEERGVERERFQGVDVFRDEESYVSGHDDDSCERVLPHEAYKREALVPPAAYGQYVENGFNATAGKEREREINEQGKSNAVRGNERDHTVHGEFMSRSEGNCSTRVKREAEIEEDEAGIYVSGEVARKRLKKFQRLHKIGKIKEKNGDDVFNILVSAELNNGSSDVSEDDGCYEEANMDEYNENFSKRHAAYGIAYMFTFHYYHTMHKNKALMHNLYADNAILIISANSINLKFLKHTLFRNKLGLNQENIFGVDVESVPFENIENLYTGGVQVNDNMLKLTNKELIDGYFNLLDVDNCTVHILSLEVVNFNEDLLIYVYGKIKKGKSNEKKYHSFVQNIRLQKYNAYQYYVVLDFVHYYDSNTDDGFFVSTEEMKKMDEFQREQILKSISQKKSEILKMKKQLSRPLVSSNAVSKKKSEQKKDVAKAKKSGSTAKRLKKENSNLEAKTKGTKLKTKKDTTQKDEAAEQKAKDKNKKKKNTPAATENVVESAAEKMKKKLFTEDNKDEEVEQVVVKNAEHSSVLKVAEAVEAVKEVEGSEVHEGIKEDTKKKEITEVPEQKQSYVDVVDRIGSEENKKEKNVENVTKMEHLGVETKNNETEGNKKKEKKSNETICNKNDSKMGVSKSGDILKESTSKNKQKKKKKEKTVDPNSWVFRVMKNSTNVERGEGSKDGARKEAEQNNNKEKKEKATTDKKDASYHRNSNASANVNKIAEDDGESEVQETTESNSEEEMQKKEREKIVSANEKKIIIHNVHKHMDKKKINDCIIERLKKYNDGHAVQIDIYERSSKKYFGAPYIYQYNSNAPNANKNGSGTSGNVHASNNSDIKNSSEKINGVANANQPYGSSYERINISEYSYAIAELDCRQSQQLLLDLGLYCNGIKLNIEQFKDKKKESSKFGKRFGGFGGYTNSSNNNNNNSGSNECDGSNSAAVEGKGKEDKMKSHFHRGKGDRHTSSPIMPIPQVGMNSFRIRRGNDRGF